MGIPSYFVYLVRNYKSILKQYNKNVKIDNFYLDCNSIIYDAVQNTEFTKNNYGFSNVEIQKLKRLYDYAIGVDDFNTKKYRKDFVKFVDEYDNRRGTNFLETFPQFTELYAENK